MTQTTTPDIAPRDNLFGICAAIGEDFGFDPLYLRVAFAVALLFNLELVLASYAGLGVVVVASRLLFPNAKRPAAPSVRETAAEAEAVPVEEPETEYRQAA